MKFNYRVLNKLKIFYESINKNQKQQQKKTDFLR